MNSNSTGVITFLLGAAIGVGTGLYLNSKNGKDMRKKIAKKASELESSVEEKVTKAYNDLKSKANDVAETTRQTAQSVKETASSAQSKVNSY